MHVISRHIVMYADLNPARSLFGGRLMEWIDVAAAMYARVQLGSSRVVTVKVSEMVFESPGHLGDFIEIYCEAKRFGTSSITIGVSALNRNTRRVIVSCEVVMVNVDDEGKPQPHGRTEAVGVELPTE